MKKFNELAPAQKKYIVTLLHHMPSVVDTGTITAQELLVVNEQLAAQRAVSGVVVGYPNWLSKSHKLSRGVYKLPLPTELEMVAYGQAALKASTKQPKQPKPAKAPKPKATAQEATRERLQKIVEESSFVDEDVEDFNDILREAGIDI